MPTASSAALDERGDRALVRGALDFTTVPALAGEGETLFRDRAALEIDLAGVERSDSAGLALLLAWYRHARHAGCTLRYTHVPGPLRQIAGFCGVEALLPFPPAAGE